MLTAQELAQAREWMLHVRDTMPGREALPLRLITGPPAPDRGPRTSGTPAACGGSTARSRGGRWSVRTSVLARRGPASCGPAHLARNDPQGGAASRTSLLPSCAGTARIRCDEGRKQAGSGGLGQGGRQSAGPGNRGVLGSATVIASAGCPERCLVKRK